MKKQKFAILDMEEAYAGNLMEYLAERRSVPFDTLIFDTVESLELYTQQCALDLLLISDKMMCDRIRQMNIRRIVILSEGMARQEYNDCPVVYKYQSSESLVAEIMSCYARQETAAAQYTGKKAAHVIGVYSPVGRCGKTCFALALGQILAARQPVLYLNLEDYAGFGALLERETPSDISDLMYFQRQNGGNLILKLNSAIQKLGNMDYIPPARSPEDVREIDLTEWAQLLETLSACSRYETILLDIGQHIRETPALLAQCGAIFMPVCTDIVSQAKVEQYERLLRNMEYEEVLNRTRKLVLPVCEPAMRGEYFLEQLVNGEMGDFIYRLLEEGV